MNQPFAISLIFQVVISLSLSLSLACVCLLTLMIQQLYNVTYRTFMSYE